MISYGEVLRKMYGPDMDDREFSWFFDVFNNCTLQKSQNSAGELEAKLQVCLTNTSELHAEFWQLATIHYFPQCAKKANTNTIMEECPVKSLSLL